MYVHKARQLDQWNRIRIPETNPHIYNQVIFNKGICNEKYARNMHWENDSLSIISAELNSIYSLNWISTCNRMKLNTYLISYTKINSRKICKCRAWNYRIPRRQHRGKSFWYYSWQWFPAHDTKSISKENKNTKVGLYQIKDLL